VTAGRDRRPPPATSARTAKAPAHGRKRAPARAASTRSRRDERDRETDERLDRRPLRRPASTASASVRLCAAVSRSRCARPPRASRDQEKRGEEREVVVPFRDGARCRGRRSSRRRAPGARVIEPPDALARRQDALGRRRRPRDAGECRWDGATSRRTSLSIRRSRSSGQVTVHSRLAPRCPVERARAVVTGQAVPPAARRRCCVR